MSNLSVHVHIYLPKLAINAQVQRTEIGGEATWERVHFVHAGKMEAEVAETGKMAQKVQVQLVRIMLKAKK